MNKKFFTLLVAFLATMSFGAFAQSVEFTTASEKYTQNKTFLFGKTTSGTEGSFLSVEITTEGKATLVYKTLDGSSLSLADYQKASWTVTVTPGAGTTSSTVTFKNQYANVLLTFDAANAHPKGESTVADDANVISGEIANWMTTVDQVAGSSATRFYVRGANADEYVGLVVDGTKVYPVLLSTDADNDNYEATGLEYFTEFTPYKASTGTFSLSPNELNTVLGLNGVYKGSATVKYATADSYFMFDITPTATQESPVTKKLQAQAVVRMDLLYGSETATISDKPYNSIRPLGTILKDKKFVIEEGKEDDAASSTSGDWFALKVEGGKYLAVDTADWAGTEQETNKRIKLKEFDLYDAKGTTKYLNPDAFLFKIMFDAKNGTYQLVSKGYNVPEYVDGKPVRAAATTENAVFYGSADPSNGYTIPPVKQGSIWFNGGTNVMTDKKLTYAKLVGETVYTLGDEPEADFKLFLTGDKKYTVAPLTSGVYILKVAAVADKKNDAWKVGRYLKANLTGTIEYAIKEVRQNYQHMPSAQWVLQRGGTSTYPTAKFTNREFGNDDGKIFGNGGVTYGAGNDADGKQQIFFFGGDTLVIESVLATNASNKELGYRKINQETLDLYSLEFLQELSMNNPVTSVNDKDSALWVNAKNDDKMYFVFKEFGLLDKYGYNGNLKNVAQLERQMYVIKVAQHYTFEDRFVTYDANSKKYALTETEADALPFLLKENNEVEGDSCYYALLQANILKDLSMIKWNAEDDEWVVADPSSTKKYIKLNHDLFKENDYAYVVGAAGENKDENGITIKDNWVPKEFDSEAEAEAVTGAGNYIESTTSGKYWAVYKSNNVATNRVSVDNNSLSLVNAVLSDGENQEVNIAAFRLLKDATKLYRTVEVDENKEALIKIHRQYEGQEYLYEDANSEYATQPLGPNKAGADRLNIYDQINFLGIGNGQVNKEDKATMLAKYQRGTVMPQYLLMFDKQEIVEEVELPCEIHGIVDGHGPKEMQLTGYSGRFLVSFTDSVKLYTDAKDKVEADKYKWQSQTRLGFVYGRVDKDYEKLTILNSSLAADKNVINIKNEGKEGPHVNAMFAFRYVSPDADYFLIESAGPVGGNDKNSWVQIKNGVPVLTGEMKFAEAIDRGAEVFNLELSEQSATSNTGITEGTYNVTAGVGTVTIEGAAGKQVVIANILGKVVKNVTLDSDYVTLSAPAGVVVVTVDGEATKALVK